MIEFKIEKKLHSASGEMILDLDIKIKEKEFVTLYGPSGSGKTTTLRIFSGLTQPDKGFIKVNNEVWLNSEKKINCSPQNRRIGYVFQDFALFQNMSVRENLNFALEKGQEKNNIDELLETMELVQLQHLKPDKLSGGQKQRVALARALVRTPQILFLDEPFSALDNEMRLKLQDYIIKVHHIYKLTTILVSHDISEVYKMSDSVIMLENGKVSKQGSPSDVFSNRLTNGKFQFIGEILKIEKENIIYMVSVLIGNNIMKILATEDEIQSFRIGNKVIVEAKSFSPTLFTINK
ncbi:sulfate/molybdate ABC transporter ATP-binding protein [soil metagenome]